MTRRIKTPARNIRFWAPVRRPPSNTRRITHPESANIGERKRSVADFQPAWRAVVDETHIGELLHVRAFRPAVLARYSNVSAPAEYSHFVMNRR